MRVMVLLKASEETEKGIPPTMEAFEAMERFTEQLVEAGILVAGAGLKNSSEAKRVIMDGSDRAIVDGPFPDTGALVAGFSIWDVKDMDEAIAWAKRSPNLVPGRSEIEIRPFLEAADMAEALHLEAPQTPGGERGKLGVA